MESKKGLFVRNLPYNTTEEELNKFFSHYGETKSCFMIKNSEGNSKGYGFVYYKSSENALKAKASVKKFKGRLITIELAKRKQENKQTEDKQTDDNAESANDGEDTDDEDDYELHTSRQQQQQKPKPKQRKSKSKEDGVSDKQSTLDVGRIVVLEGLEDSVTTRRIRVRCRKIGEVESVECPVPGRLTKTAFVKYVKHDDARVAVKKFDGKIICGGHVKAVLLSREGKTPSKASLKKSRLIIRNLKFKCSEDVLKEVFSPYGNVIEVHIPKKNDQSRGYGFIQYGSYFNARKAMEGINGTLIEGRKVAVDFLAPKNAKELNEKIIIESNGTNKNDKENEIKNEKEDKDGGDGDGSDNGDSDGSNNGDGDGSDNGGGDGDGSDNGDGDGDGSDNGDGSDEEMDQTSDNEQLTGSSKKMVDDVKEGKTLFIRNVPYDADEEELRSIMERFGHVRYCRLVQGGITGVCRGTAFIQYIYDSSVKQCLEVCGGNEGVIYNDSRLDVTLALSKKELYNIKKKEDTASNKTDKRNLYLLQEGVILRDSDAAKDLSKTELLRRIKSYDERKRKLKNPYYYISKTRLSVRNLPVTIIENKLKGLFKTHAGKSSVMKQVKLMRSKDKFTEEGLGRPLGFGFVEFTQHEAALKALRAINNNPSIFGPQRRPIVEFAIEDTRAIKLMKERKKQSYGSTNDNDVHHNNPQVKWKLKCKARRLKRKEVGLQGNKAAIKSKQSTIKKERDIKKPNTEQVFKITSSLKMKNERTQRLKRVRETDAIEGKNRKQPKIIPKTAKNEQKFDDLVNKYRNKLSSQESRWFE